jgi:hypothetical protein
MKVLLNVESSTDDVMPPSTHSPIYCKRSADDLLTNIIRPGPREVADAV